MVGGGGGILTCKATRLLAAVVFLTPATASAQLVARGDALVSGRYVWHGISAADATTFQPSLAVGWRAGGFGLDGGLVWHYELDRRDLGELGESPGGKGLGERDAWTRASVESGILTVQIGTLHRRFQDPFLSPAGRTSTDEIVVTMATRHKYLNPSLQYWHDVDDSRGRYLQAGARMPIFAWPFPRFWFLSIEAEAGCNLGRESPLGFDGTGYQRVGLTHLRFGMTGSIRAHRWPGFGFSTIVAGVNTQANFDLATRLDGGPKTRKLATWVWAGLSILVGREAARLR